MGKKTFNEDDIWVVSMLYLKKKKRLQGSYYKSVSIMKYKYIYIINWTFVYNESASRDGEYKEWEFQNWNT